MYSRERTASLDGRGDCHYDRFEGGSERKKKIKSKFEELLSFKWGNGESDDVASGFTLL